MARRPIEDERFLVPERVGRPGGVVIVTELAAYLREHIRTVQVFAREHGLLHRKSRGGARKPVLYVTEEGAMRIIAVFRTKQGLDIQNNTRRAYLRARNAGRR